MTTSNEIKKDVERMINTLTPDEKAKYLLNEEMKLGTDAVSGKNIEGREDELDSMYNKYVLPLHLYEQLQFWRAMYFESNRLWARDFFNAILTGLKCENHFIDFLILEKENRQLMRMLESDEGPNWKYEMKRIEKQMKILQSRKQENEKEILEILSVNFWERLDIEKP